MRLALAALLLLAPAVASARPITVGASYGMIQSKSDAGSDPNSQMTAFGRVGLGSRLEAGLELQDISAGDNSTVIRTISGLVLVDLGHSHLMPMLLGDVGVDHSATTYGSATDAHHFEAGFALEYRAESGLVLGGDLRIGDRSIDSNSDMVYPLSGGAIARTATSQLSDGEYRSARLYVGVRF